ncbi:Tryptase beta-2 [Sciurus carolinensis]|uniref:Tryptase beta-2 n=1 Tax=Sciurus carolinensis TaxID=30640 RepID=A0AA41MYF5_SCICA|nr:Tryptase beta-2 [Sciurus carolinensis]
MLCCLTQAVTGFSSLLHAPLLPAHSLQEAKVNFVESMFCNTIYRQTYGKGKDYSVHEEMLCARDTSAGKDICQGDSGSPLVCYGPNDCVLVGLGSWGLECWHPVYPSIFTRVPYFIDWINEVRRLSPPPDPPPTDIPQKPLRASASLQPYSTLVSSQTWLLLPFTLKVQWQAHG